MLEYFNLGGNGVNTYLSPMNGQDGQLIHAVNVVGFPAGALSKRPGYSAFLGTPDNAQINNLLAYPQQDGTTLFLYRASGSALYYSAQGTGAWTLAGNGTITNGNHVQGAILLNTLILGDGAGSTRHTTDGTAFTDTPGAPVAQYFAQFHNKIYATDGTTSSLITSTTGDATVWSIGGTSDATSYTVPDEGAGGQMMVAGDRLVITKTKGKMFHWDDYSMVDMTTRYGPSSPYSVASIDDYWFYANQVGIFGFDGANKNLISNPIQRQFYNRANTGIGTATWGTAPGVAHIWDYFCAVGTITDDFTGRQINNAIVKYDYQKNLFLNWQFNDAPTAFCSYIDVNNKYQLIFGNSSGQAFQLDNTKTSDNGNPIASEMVFLFSYAQVQQQVGQQSALLVPGMSYQKKWNWLRIFLNPGAELNMQFSFADTFTYQHLKWSSVVGITAPSDGVFEYRFPMDANNSPRSRLLFVRLYENSDNAQYTFYGIGIDAEPQVIK